MTRAYEFGPFVLDRADRRLSRDGTPIDLSARYFDALALLIEESGRLVTKDRFMDTVWQGVPVTDEALTQCIRSLRKALGDEAGRPRFIETVPKHGYRFVGTVTDVGKQTASPGRGRHVALLALAGTIGGGLAGLVGGMIYGVAGASDPAGQEIGGVSILLALICVTIATAAIGAAGVSLGLAIQCVFGRKSALGLMAGGALGGLIVGLVGKLILVDAFRLLFGQSPGAITGAFEGIVLGGAVGLAVWTAGRSLSSRRGLFLAAAIGGTAGLAIALSGRPLMAGSLVLLAEQVPGSRLTLEPIGAFLGENDFGPLAGTVTATLEGALFALAITLAMRLAAKEMGMDRTSP